MHFHKHVWRAQPARYLGSQTACADRDPRAFQADRHRDAGHANLRTHAAIGAPQQPAERCPLDDAPAGRSHQGEFDDALRPIESFERRAFVWCGHGQAEAGPAESLGDLARTFLGAVRSMGDRAGDIARVSREADAKAFERPEDDSLQRHGVVKNHGILPRVLDDGISDRERVGADEDVKQ